jgi:acyl carrier protein
VAAVVAQVFGLAEVPAPSVRSDEIPGWDSLGTLELVLALEAAFEVSIDERRLVEVRTVGDLRALVG